MNEQNQIYNLVEAIEGYRHVKVNFEINQTDVNGDLGNIETINGEDTFIPKYTSAVIRKNLIENYEEREY